MATFVTSGEFTPDLFQMYPSSKKLNSPLAIGTVSSSEVQIFLKGVSRSQLLF